MVQGEIEVIRALLSSKPRPVGWAERRQRLDDVGSIWPVADDVKLAAVDVGGVPGEWSIVPGSDASRVLMFFHGGGYCSGSLLSHRRMVTEAGRAAGMRTLAIAYRLAPEHPFPAAFDDALTAWRFLLNQGIAPAKMAIGGDSAGGGLTLALMNHLRDCDEELPPCAWLVSLWTDLDPRVSPLYADLRGYPPTLIQVGSAETLLEDATRFTAVAGAANVPVTLEIWPHMIHAWHLWNAHLEPGRKALVSTGVFIRRHFRMPEAG